MKHKILIFSLATLSLFTLTGCSNRETKAITNLENQIKRVENIISNTNTDDLSSVSPVTTYNSSSNTIQNHRANSFNNMTRENQIKEDVLSLNASLKSCLQKNITLGKNKSSAIKTLSSNISKNLSKFSDTKNEIKSSIKNIKQNMKLPNINIVNAESEYIILNGNMGERYVYLCNIYDNLEQAYIIICDCCENKTQSKDTEQATDIQDIKPDQNQTSKNSRFKKNIDSYAPITNDIEKQVKNNEKTENHNNDYRNIDSFTNYKPPVSYRYNTPYNYGYNMPYNYANGYNGFAYGYANGYRRFNPNGNTDTFYPYNRNIDTYKTIPNLNQPVSTSPIEEREDSLKNKENGVIKIQEEPEDIIIEIPEEVEGVENLKNIAHNTENIKSNTNYIIK